MSGTVCDLVFIPYVTSSTPSSNPTASDGSVITQASSSTGTIRYSINGDIPYFSRTNTTGTFTGLVPGSYIVNARTSNGCMAEITVIVSYEVNYGVKYRLQYGTVSRSGFSHKFDIEELYYAGPILYPEYGSEPVTIEGRNEGGIDPFATVIGSVCTVNLNSRTDGEFDELNTYDEVKYRGSWYVNEVLKFQGFLTPMNSEESYNQKTNYDVSLTFIDGLQDLEYKEFSDEFGNPILTRISILDAVLACLKKTNLELGIKESANLYPDGTVLDGVSSILGQIYFNPDVFKNDDGTYQNCKQALNDLLVSISGQIKQSDGYWQIDNPTLKTGSATPTRNLASDGGTINGTNYDYRVRLRSNQQLAPRITFSDQSGRKLNIPMYGEIKFVHDLGIDGDNNNMLVTGEFEDQDIDNGQLKGWAITQTQDPSEVALSIETDSDRTGKTMFQAIFDTSTFNAPFPTVSIPEKYVILTADDVIIDEFAAGTVLKVSFDVKAFIENTIQSLPYVCIDYSMSFIDNSGVPFIVSRLSNGDYAVFQTTLVDNTLVDGEWLRTFIDDAEQWKSVSFDVTQFDTTSIDWPLTMSFKIRIVRNSLYDVNGLVQLKAIDTDGVNGLVNTQMNNRRRQRFTIGSNVYIRTYFLQGGEETADDFETVKPDDSSVYVWKLQNKFYDQQNILAWLRKINLRHVVVSYLPGGQQPESTIEEIRQISTNVKNTLDVSLPFADLPDDINLKNVSKSWFSFEDGTPTSLWKILGAPDSLNNVPKNLIGRMADLYTAQYRTQRWKLSGVFDLVEAMPLLSNTVLEERTGKVYVVSSNRIMTHGAQAEAELIEALESSDIQPPPPINDFDSDDFDSNDFYI